MAKVVFSLTDAQVSILREVGATKAVSYRTDPRTTTGLEKRGLIVNGEPGSWHSRKYTLSPSGAAVLKLCELLAILPAKKGKT